MRIKFSISQPSGVTSVKVVVVSDSDKVGDVKALHFAEELASGHAVRFVFQGRLLDDNSFLSTYCGPLMLHDDSTLLVHITRRATGAQQTSQRDAVDEGPNEEEGLGSAVFYVVVGIILGYAWFWRLRQPSYFDSFSEVSLGVFTIFWVTAVAAFIVDRGKLMLLRRNLRQQ